MEHMQHASAFVLAVIFINYLIYAANVFRLARKTKMNRSRAIVFGWLSLVFIFCGICHITGMLGQEWWTVREALYWLLAFLSCGLNFSNQASVMAAMIGERDGQG